MHACMNIRSYIASYTQLTIDMQLASSDVILSAMRIATNFTTQGHIKHECQMATMSCPIANEGCKKTFVKSKVDCHVQNCQYSRNFNNQQCKQDTFTNHSISTERNSTMQQCCYAFLGCLFVGNSSEVTAHIENI